MLGLLTDNINNGLLFIYGLIAVVVVLIIIIIAIDKCDSKKRKNKKSLSDTLSMKPVKDDDFENTEIEILNIISKRKTEELINMQEVSKVEEKPKNNYEYIHREIYVEPKARPVEEKVEPVITKVEPTVEKVETVRLEPKFIQPEVLAEEEDYIEDELEKTQAQIRVESITKALEEAGVDEKIEHDKYAKFEEEQEKNAFISYDELKDNYDRLYEENEKSQYVDDNTIPINIKELYEAAHQEDLNTKVEILEEEPIEAKHADNEIKSASSFLNNLKELRDNLD